MPSGVQPLALRLVANAGQSCQIHDRERTTIDPIIHHEGGLYSTTEAFTVCVCPDCLASLGEESWDCYSQQLEAWFMQWDSGDAPGDWFRFLGDGSADSLADTHERSITSRN